jgi:hypothetical protein
MAFFCFYFSRENDSSSLDEFPKEADLLALLAKMSADPSNYPYPPTVIEGRVISVEPVDVVKSWRLKRT